MNKTFYTIYFSFSLFTRYSKKIKIIIIHTLLYCTALAIKYLVLYQANADISSAV